MLKSCGCYIDDVNVHKAPKRGRLGKVGGTQCLDRLWGVLKAWLPRQLNIKKKSEGHGMVNPHLKETTYQWLWHGNKTVNDKFTPEQMLKDLGKLCKWRP